jgi:hypothetical protein
LRQKLKIPTVFLIFNVISLQQESL